MGWERGEDSERARGLVSRLPVEGKGVGEGKGRMGWDDVADRREAICVGLRCNGGVVSSGRRALSTRNDEIFIALTDQT
jgi:hypothetical protein